MPATAIESRPAMALQALQAYYDDVTGLPNQLLFMDRLSHALLGACRRGSGVAVFFIEVQPATADPEGSDEPLDAQTGGALLRAVGERLENRLRPNDTLARLAGGQFLLLLEDMHRPVDASNVAERLVQALQQPLAADRRMLSAQAAAGVSARTQVDLQVQADELVLEAERALRQAQRNGLPWALITGELIDTEVSPESPCVQ
ncbi:MAG TPA: GGDEF domain-containing protein [Dehalococcoidia bacterium]|nr:GGDEF domain-containing protein [Dehalococcoidia bacterium]